jgi:hypothetical protein
MDEWSDWMALEVPFLPAEFHGLVALAGALGARPEELVRRTLRRVVAAGRELPEDGDLPAWYHGRVTAVRLMEEP